MGPLQPILYIFFKNRNNCINLFDSKSDGLMERLTLNDYVRGVNTIKKNSVERGYNLRIIYVFKFVEDADVG